MIKSFKDKETAKIWKGKKSKKLPPYIQKTARRKLRMIENSAEISDLRIPPKNLLEKLKGDRQGQWSIRINNQYRICFYFKSGNAYEVEIVDYH